jgi:hypothetical protein
MGNTVSDMENTPGNEKTTSSNVGSTPGTIEDAPISMEDIPDGMKNTQNIQRDNEKLIFKWQQKLLPWFIIMPTILIGIFIFLATQQLVKFNEKLQTKPDSTLIGKILPVGEGRNISDGKYKYLLLTVLAHLEQESTYRRYNQGALLLMSRIFTKYLGFFTGMILAIVGAVFIIGKIREDSTSLTANVNEMMKFSLISSSPGIIFGVLGTILMLATILKHNDITVQDSPLYLNANTILAIELVSSNPKDTTGNSIDLAKLDSTRSIWRGKK